MKINNTHIETFEGLTLAFALHWIEPNRVLSDNEIRNDAKTDFPEATNYIKRPERLIKQYGLSNHDHPGKEKIYCAAAIVGKEFPGENIAGVIKINDFWWIFQFLGGVIQPDGDQVFKTFESAKNAFQAMLTTFKEPDHIFAPEDFNISKSKPFPLGKLKSKKKCELKPVNLKGHLSKRNLVILATIFVFAGAGVLGWYVYETKFNKPVPVKFNPNQKSGPITFNKPWLKEPYFENSINNCFKFLNENLIVPFGWAQTGFFCDGKKLRINFQRKDGTFSSLSTIYKTLPGSLLLNFRGNGAIYEIILPHNPQNNENEPLISENDINNKYRDPFIFLDSKFLLEVIPDLPITPGETETPPKPPFKPLKITITTEKPLPVIASLFNKIPGFYLKTLTSKDLKQWTIQGEFYVNR